MERVLLNKKADKIIAEYVAINIKNFHRLNAILITFKGYSWFSIACVEYSRMHHPLPKSISTDFYLRFKLRLKFEDTIVFRDIRHKGTTRAKMYKIALYNGFYYTTTDREKYEKRYQRRAFIYSESWIDERKLYTKKEIIKLRLDIPGVWFSTDKLNDKGEQLLSTNGKFGTKRGIMATDTCTMIFTKIK